VSVASIFKGRRVQEEFQMVGNVEIYNSGGVVGDVRKPQICHRTFLLCHLYHHAKDKLRYY
jgi:hypothetical protein